MSTGQSVHSLDVSTAHINQIYRSITTEKNKSSSQVDGLVGVQTERVVTPTDVEETNG